MPKKITFWIGTGFLAWIILLGGLWALDFFLSPRPLPVKLADHWQAAPMSETPEGVRQWSDCLAFRREGIAACSLQGQPELRGAALARFYPEEKIFTTDVLLACLQKQLPWALARWCRVRVWAWQHRHLARYLPPYVRREAYGFSQVAANSLPLYGSFYPRLLQEQMAYDMAHGLDEDQVVTGTMLGVTREHTEAHSPLMACNLDFRPGDGLDQNKVVVKVQPQVGHAFIGITWPGVFGVLSGVNDAGLGVALLAVPSAPDRGVGMPLPILARKVLTEAVTLKQALAIIQAAPVVVSESFLLGSGSENHFWVVEKTPACTAVRDMENGAIMATGYFLSPQLASPPAHKFPLRSGPAVARLRRVQELMYLQTEPLGISGAVKILRDVRAEYEVRLGLGHAEAVNSLAAVQSVILDLGRKKIWVSQAPHQLGKFVPFELGHFLEFEKKEEIEAAPLLVSGKYNEYLSYCRGLETAGQLFRGRKYQESLSWLQEIYLINPLDYRAFLQAGRALEALGRWDEALYNFQQASKLHPAFPREKEELLRRIQELSHDPDVAPEANKK